MRQEATPQRRSAGFSLIELAIVLMIIGTLMSGVLVAVSRTTASAKITAGQTQLREVEAALYGYAQATGRLPCPASNITNGIADPAGDGICNTPNGFVPVTTLGLAGSINADGLLLDPWQQPLRYSVATQVCATCGSNPSFTSTDGLAEVFDDGSVATTNMLRVCSMADCTDPQAIIYADTVPALIYSMGANWATFTSTNETQNADGTLGAYAIKTDADDDFVSATYSEDNFDDQILWLSPYVLFNRLVSAGKLP